MRTGVHCSVRKGFVGALQEAVSLGCETFQMFTQSPRGWMTRVYTDNEFLDFRKEREKSSIDPVVVHAPYLPNLCTSNEELYQKSLKTLKDDLRRTTMLGAEFLVVHPGAYSPEADGETGIKRLAAAFNEAIAEIDGNSKVLIENMAGGGRRMGGPFLEIKKMLDQIKNRDRVGVCFDTCHAFAAGYDLSTEQGVRKTLDEFDKTIGMERIHVFHVNDSKGACSSHRDLHEGLGRGKIGKEGFGFLFKDKRIQAKALILETPKEPMPEMDLENLRVLRSFLKK
jgi:deoxyribonuclease-4